MEVITKLFVSAVLLLRIFNGFGNGGPIDGSSVNRFGEIVLINVHQIKLLNEDLNMTLLGDYTEVSVKYNLVNEGYSDKLITYGFPIEIARTEFNWDMEWSEENLDYIEIKLNGKKLNILHQIDYQVLKSEKKFFEEYGLDVRKSWHVVEFEIPRAKTAQLTVEYKIKNQLSDWLTTKSFKPTFSNRVLTYDFSPAKHWKNGITTNLKVSVDAQEIVKNGGQVVSFDGLELIENESIYTGQFRGFDFNKSKELTIICDISSQKLSAYYSENRVGLKQINALNTSSQLQGNYSVDNLLDFNFETAWVEGKPDSGDGESITFELNDYKLTAIGIINGYTKNEETYLANNRIKKLRIEKQVVDYKDSTKTRIDISEIELEDKPYVKIQKKSFDNMVSIIADYGDGWEKVRKVTLTILEVYKGNKFNDTCISEVLLL